MEEDAEMGNSGAHVEVKDEKDEKESKHQFGARGTTLGDRKPTNASDVLGM